MAIKLDALIARTAAAIESETDPKKLARLQAQYGAFLATKAEMDDDEGDKGDDKDEEDEDSKAKKAAAAAKKAKAKAEAGKHRAKAAEYKAKAAESEEAAKKAEEEAEEEEEESEAKARAASASGDHAALLASLAASVKEIKTSQAASAKTTLIAGARATKAITKAEAAWLESQQLGTVEGFLQLRAKAGLVATSEEALVKPRDAKPGTEQALSPEVVASIDAAVNAMGAHVPDRAKYREALVKAHLEDHAKQLANGAGSVGRY